MLRVILNSIVKRPPDRRRDGRAAGISGSVSLSGKLYHLKDLSSRGFAIRGYRGELCPGDRVPLSLSLGRSGEGLDFACQAVIVRVERGRGELAGVFADLDGETREAISDYIDVLPLPDYAEPPRAMHSD